MKQQNNGMPLLVTKDEKYICDPIPIANTFNNFLHLLLRLFPQKIKFSNKFFTIFLLTEKNDSFNITATNKEGIYNMISSLNNNKSCEPNTFQLKLCTKIKNLTISLLYVNYFP